MNENIIKAANDLKSAVDNFVKSLDGAVDPVASGGYPEVGIILPTWMDVAKQYIGLVSANDLNFIA